MLASPIDICCKLELIPMKAPRLALETLEVTMAMTGTKRPEIKTKKIVVTIRTMGSEEGPRFVIMKIGMSESGASI